MGVSRGGSIRNTKTRNHAKEKAHCAKIKTPSTKEEIACLQQEKDQARSQSQASPPQAEIYLGFG
jgi:hypothetical protein